MINILQLVCALILIESGGDPTALGDSGKAVGLLQIHPIMVRECNRISGRKRWTLSDRTDPTESVKMCCLFLSYQKAKHPETSLMDLGVAWNTGRFGKNNPNYRNKLWKKLYR